MAKRTATISVDPELLKWARESAGLSEAQAAKKVGVRPAERYPDWEAEGRPTPRQLERLADAARRPVAAFFLPGRPQEPPVPTDFRVAGDAELPELPTALRFAVRRARRVLRIYEELGGRQVAQPLRLTPGSLDASAANAREILSVSLEEQASWGGAATALEQWRARIEALGVLVLQFNLARETVSGFSLSNAVSGIVINKSDHESRRCFTLFHEWAHLLLGEPGLCNVDEGHVATPDQGVEAYCNAFAAEVLVPLRSLQSSAMFTAASSGRRGLDAAIAAGVARYGVSRWVVLIRLRTAGAITRREFDQVAEEWNAEVRPPKRRGGRSRPYRQAIQNLGVPYVRRVLAACDTGEITRAEATDYLGLKLRWFPELEALAGR